MMGRLKLEVAEETGKVAGVIDRDLSYPADDDEGITVDQFH